MKMNKKSWLMIAVLVIMLVVIYVQRAELIELENNQPVEVPLQECPFCGGDAELRTVGEYFEIKCSKCELETKYNRSKDKLVKYWNTRVQ